jgi:type IV pilus assembly protein PilO
MAKKPNKTSIDLAALQAQIRSQFAGLDPNQPAEWPALPRYLMLVVLGVLVVVGLWYGWLTGYNDQLEAERNQEVQLREQYRGKLVQAVNLEALKQQLEQVQQYVTQLEKQLPSKAEMDALLSDINQAGLGRSLQFDLFRPGAVNVKEYYAEQPISLRVTGGYHDIALFAADIAALSRIVTLNNLTLTPAAGKPNVLVLDTTAKTFRYLDPDEVLAQKKNGKPGGAK